MLVAAAATAAARRRRRRHGGAPTCRGGGVDSAGSGARERPGIVFVVSLRSSSFWFAVVLLMAACGGSGSGSDAGGEPSADVDSHALVVRWQPTADAIGYVVHWGTRSRAYDRALDVGAPPPDARGESSAIFEYVGAPGAIYVSLTSYDRDGRSSAFSNEIAAAVP
jgi:hypothetical protein